MATMREAWTDERLDDLNKKVDNGFDRVDARFDRLETKLDRMDERWNERIEALEARIDTRFDSLYHVLIQGGVLIITALIGLIATAIGVAATQL